MCIGYLLSWNSSGSGVILSVWFYPRKESLGCTHPSQALRVQLLWVPEEFGVCTSRPDLAPLGCAQLSCPCSPAPPALFLCFSPDVCVVLPAHSHSCSQLALGTGIWGLTSLKSHREAKSPHLSQEGWTGHLFLDGKCEYDGWSYTCLICEGKPPSYSGPPALPSTIGVESQQSFLPLFSKITLKNN